ncbi:MAG: redoxin domain-containing protein [Lewinellaceae bacterium]|nr:redoxin domain-containing protein [Lewinellaceae bacterium]
MGLFVCGLATAQAPDFTITDSGGKTHHLYADYVNKGKVVVLDIFFINCPPCAAHAPHFQNLYQQIKSTYGDRVEFFLLSDKGADINPFVAQYRTDKALTMPVVGSDGGSLTAVQPYKSGQFGTFFGTPTFVVIAPGTGQVFFDVRGNNAAATMNLVSQKIAELLPRCRINTPQGDTLAQYQLTLATPGGGVSVSRQVTGGGYFLDDFSDLPALPFYEAVPAKNDNPLNGVSTLDLLQINRHILGIESFQHAWQLVAADANNSGSLSVFDILELRKLILGIYDTLPLAPSWVFSPPMDTLWPLQCPDFMAIKKGDVNGTSDPKGLLATTDRHADPWPIRLVGSGLVAGEVHTVHVRTGKRGNCAGLQAAFRYDAGALRIHSVRAPGLSGFDENAWHDADGRLTLSWFSPEQVEVADESVLLELDILALRDGPFSAFWHLEDTPLRAEVYDAAGGVFPVDWRIDPENLAAAAVLSPNPAHGYFWLRLENAASGPTPLQLLDMRGKVVFEKNDPPRNRPECYRSCSGAIGCRRVRGACRRTGCRAAGVGNLMEPRCRASAFF